MSAAGLQHLHLRHSVGLRQSVYWVGWGWGEAASRAC